MCAKPLLFVLLIKVFSLAIIQCTITMALWSEKVSCELCKSQMKRKYLNEHFQLQHPGQIVTCT